MTDLTTFDQAAHARQTARFPLGAWVRANAIGLGTGYGLFALFGGGVEMLLAVAHDSIVRDVAIMCGLFIGAGLFVALRRRVLDSYIDRSTGTAVAAGIGLAAGFVVGFVIAGPPFDFIVGVIALGTIGSALQWRMLRQQVHRAGGLLVAMMTAWLTAGVAAGAVAFLAGDAIATTLGGDTLAGFVAVTAAIGAVAGAVGGAIEGAALRTRIRRPARQ